MNVQVSRGDLMLLLEYSLKSGVEDENVRAAFLRIASSIGIWGKTISEKPLTFQFDDIGNYSSNFIFCYKGYLQNKKIPCIKVVRQHQNNSLKDAKNWVEKESHWDIDYELAVALREIAHITVQSRN